MDIIITTVPITTTTITDMCRTYTSAATVDTADTAGTAVFAPPIDPYCGRGYVPYGAGYSGGYQPYQQFHYQGSRLGFSIGF